MLLIQLLANMSQGVDDVMSIAYDWITRVLYFATSDEFQTLTIWSLPLDNPLFQSINTRIDLSNDSYIFMTIAPFTGYANNLIHQCKLLLILSTGICTG